MHRSGTSMITRALTTRACTSSAGRRGAHRRGRGQPRGLLGEQGRSSPATTSCSRRPAARGTTLPISRPRPPTTRAWHLAEAATAALAGLQRARSHWGFKDPRLCLTAAYWLDLQPDLRFIVCRPPPARGRAVAEAPQPELVLARARALGAVLRHGARAVPPDRRIVTHYDTFFVDPEGELARVCEFAGLDRHRPTCAPTSATTPSASTSPTRA